MSASGRPSYICEDLTQLFFVGNKWYHGTGIGETGKFSYWSYFESSKKCPEIGGYYNSADKKYILADVNCKPIGKITGDNCEDKPCPENQYCENLFDGYACHCNDGFIGKIKIRF
jgi:hypothetical protein